MVDKIQKFLSKLSKKDLLVIQEIKNKLLVRDFKGLDIRKIKGKNYIYRVRKKDIRIIYFDDLINPIRMVLAEQTAQIYHMDLPRLLGIHSLTRCLRPPK